MDALKRNLTQYDIAFTEKVFTSNESIDGLMPEAFVSNNNDSDLRMYLVPFK